MSNREQPAGAAMRVLVRVCISAALLAGQPAHAAIQYVHTDALGSPVAVTDEERNVLERGEYEPYGKLLSGPVKDGPGFTGHVTDAVTGLSYMQQRYYDPEIGRFLSVDPVSPMTGPKLFSRYSYAANNPYRFRDPDGRICTGSHIENDAGDCASTGTATTQPGAGSGAAVPMAQAKTVTNAPSPQDKGQEAGKEAVHKVNQGLDRSRNRVTQARDAKLTEAWNKTNWIWDPNDQAFKDEPNLGAFVNPADPFAIHIGFRLAAFEDSSQRFTYQGASFVGGNVAITFVLLHEFGHVWTQGQGKPGSKREMMANSFARSLLSTKDKREIECPGCE